MKFLKKNSIKVPENVSLLYCFNKKILTILGPLKTKSIKLYFEIILIEKNKLIYVTSKPFFKISNKKKKQIKALKGTNIAIIKQAILETTIITFKKLNFVGVGYKTFYVENLKNRVLLFKLGFSHSLYFKVPKTLNSFCLKQTKLFLYGTSYQTITQTAFLIQSCKFPEPYKGKGILYENKKIKLKEGKKT